MEDLNIIKRTIGGLILIIVVLFFAIFVLHVIQSFEISNLNDKLDKIEPIIDDYCNSNNKRLDFCGEVLKGYNNNGIIINKP